MRGLRADTDAIEEERRNLFDEVQGWRRVSKSSSARGKRASSPRPGNRRRPGGAERRRHRRGPHLAPPHAGARARTGSLETADSYSTSVGRSTVGRPFSHDPSPRSSGPSISAHTCACDRRPRRRPLASVAGRGGREARARHRPDHRRACARLKDVLAADHQDRGRRSGRRYRPTHSSHHPRGRCQPFVILARCESIPVSGRTSASYRVGRDAAHEVQGPERRGSRRPHDFQRPELATGVVRSRPTRLRA
jgi:hypothetical protein